MKKPYWIWQYAEWPHFCWNNDSIIASLARIREKQGRLLGLMDGLGFDVQNTSSLEVMTEDVLRNSEIEGLLLNADNVRSSMDAVQQASTPLTEERLFNWHAALFPTGRSGATPITVAAWRTGEEPMLVVSGAMGKERIHYEAPPSDDVPRQMQQFIQWFNSEPTTDPVLKAAIAHLWFVNIHPFDDGNGRLTRTLTDMLLARADGSPRRFYSMSAAILRDRNNYYDLLEYMGKHGLDITRWLVWFLQTMENAIDTAVEKTQRAIQKSLFWQEHRNVALNERQIKVINRLWDGFEGKLNTSKWAKMTKTSAATALRDIQDLVDKGILCRAEEGGRSTHYELAYTSSDTNTSNDLA